MNTNPSNSPSSGAGTPPPITPDEAAASLHAHQQLRAHIAAGSARYVAWLFGMASASLLYLFALGTHRATGPDADVAAIVALSVCFAVWVGLLSVLLLPGGRVRSRGFEQRFGLALGAWGLVFGLGLGLGLGFELPALFFWAAAVISVIPLLIGAMQELRGPQ